MADNFNYDMQQLQQDAIRRAREMQARAQIPVPVPTPTAARTAPVQNTRPESPSAPPPVRHAPPVEQHVPLNIPPTPAPRNAPVPTPKIGPLKPIGDIFESLLADSERTLILVLIILLVEEKADTGVIFALMYLVL